MAGTGGGDCKGVASGAMLVSWHPQHEVLCFGYFPCVYIIQPEQLSDW